MTEPLEVAVLGDRIVVQPAPILFLDTSAILDVLRVPFMVTVQQAIAESAWLLAGTTLEPKRVWLVTSSNVQREYDENYQKVRDELTRKLHDLTLSLSRLVDVARMIYPERRHASIDLMELGVEHGITDFLQTLVKSVVTFSGTDRCAVKAGARVKARIAPASEKKQEFKDCEIFEEFLELMTTVRAQGCTELAIFVSSNTTDYGAAPDGYPPIASALSKVNARYATNLSHARALITRR